MKPGTRVRSQGVIPKEGMVIRKSSFDGWVVVEWDDGEVWDEYPNDLDVIAEVSDDRQG